MTAPENAAELLERVEVLELKFTNSDARPKVTVLQVHRDAVAPIMAWYGAYYAGDRYTVHADGEKLVKDQNGELVTGAALRLRARASALGDG